MTTPSLGVRRQPQSPAHHDHEARELRERLGAGYGLASGARIVAERIHRPDNDQPEA